MSWLVVVLSFGFVGCLSYGLWTRRRKFISYGLGLACFLCAGVAFAGVKACDSGGVCTVPVSQHTAAVASPSGINGGVIYTISRANSNNLTAYQEGTWAKIGTWTVPNMEQSAYTQNYMTTPRGTAYDNGTLFISAGNYSPQSAGVLSGQVIAWDLTNNATKWTTTFTGDGVDQIAACNGYVYVPRGEGSSGTSWTVLNESDGSTAGTINGPTVGPHNTICTPDNNGNYHLYLGGRCLDTTSCPSGTNTYLGQRTCTGATCTSQPNLGPQPVSNPGVRPFTVGQRDSNGVPTRAWITWTHYRGFSLFDASTGADIKDVNFGAYQSSCSGLSSQSHGISVAPDNSEVYVIDAPSAMVRVYDGTDSANSITNVSVDPWCGRTETSTYCGGPDCTPDGWVQHTMDGDYVLVGGSGDVIQTSNHAVVVNSASAGDAASLFTDLANDEHGYISIQWSGGAPQSGSHFGIGG